MKSRTKPLNRKQIVEICIDRRSFNEIAKSFQVSEDTIYNIKRGKVYTRFSAGVEIYIPERLVLKYKDLVQIKNDERTYSEIAFDLNLQVKTIELIKGYNDV